MNSQIIITTLSGEVLLVEPKDLNNFENIEGDYVLCNNMYTRFTWMLENYTFKKEEEALNMAVKLQAGMNSSVEVKPIKITDSKPLIGVKMSSIKLHLSRKKLQEIEDNERNNYLHKKS